MTCAIDSSEVCGPVFRAVLSPVLPLNPLDIRDAFYVSARFEWKPDDPEIVSDVLFAVANVLSIARTTYLMPAFEVLGPLQISLGRMIGDITRFLVLFTLVRI